MDNKKFKKNSGIRMRLLKRYLLMCIGITVIGVSKRTRVLSRCYFYGGGGVSIRVFHIRIVMYLRVSILILIL